MTTKASKFCVTVPSHYGVAINLHNKSLPLALVVNTPETSVIVIKQAYICRRAHSVDHVDVIKWKHFPRYLPFVRGIHRSTVNSPHKGQWCGALMFSLICARIIGWVNNDEAGDFRCHGAHYDVTVMLQKQTQYLGLLRVVHYKALTSLSFIFALNSEWHCLYCILKPFAIVVYLLTKNARYTLC